MTFRYDSVPEKAYARGLFLSFIVGKSPTKPKLNKIYR